jgi:hypothetical protein
MQVDGARMREGQETAFNERLQGALQRTAAPALLPGIRRKWHMCHFESSISEVRCPTPAQAIARKLGRSIDAVYVKASREGISLRLMPSSRPNWNGESRQSS